MGLTIYGSRGTLRYQRGQVVIEPESSGRPGRGAALEAKAYKVEPYDYWATHVENFLSCMRTRQKPILDGDLGYKIMVAVKLGVDSYREGKVAFFDPQREKVVRSGPPRDRYEGDGRNYEEFPRRT